MPFDLGTYSFISMMDDEDSSSSHCTMLSWKLPQNESFSDWKIIVKIANSSSSSSLLDTTDDPHKNNNNNNDNNTAMTTTKTYHVHKNILGLGQRYSEYFAKLFHSPHLREAQLKTSEITLEPSAAAAFPAMLDYIYDGELKIKTDVAVALRHLANYFGVRDLFEEVSSFMQSDLTFDTMAIYWEEGTIYSDDALIQAMIPMVARNFKDIHDDFLVKIQPAYLINIVSCAELDCESEILSRRVACYLQQSSQVEISSELVYSLTCPKRMPVIAPETALFYVNLDGDHCDQSCDDYEDEDDKLLSRCAKAFVNSEYSTELFTKDGCCSSKNDSSSSSNKNNTNPIMMKYRTEYENLSLTSRLKLLESSLYHEKHGKETIDDFASMLSHHEGCTVVWGAGTQSVNGVFRPSGTRDGYTLYTKYGVWNGRKSVFALYRYDDKTWYISFWPEKKPSGEIDIYSCTTSSSSSSSNSGGMGGGGGGCCGVGSSCLPTNNWEKVAGEYPPPKLLQTNDLYALVKCFKG